jgi:hypothetical protein
MLDHGCRFILGSPSERDFCGADRQPGSSYCAHHHAICYVRPESAQERVVLREIAALAATVGGKMSRRPLSEALLRSLAASAQGQPARKGEPKIPRILTFGTFGTFGT